MTAHDEKIGRLLQMGEDTREDMKEMKELLAEWSANGCPRGQILQKQVDGINKKVVALGLMIVAGGHAGSELIKALLG